MTVHDGWHGLVASAVAALGIAPVELLAPIEQQRLDVTPPAEPQADALGPGTEGSRRLERCSAVQMGSAGLPRRSWSLALACGRDAQTARTPTVGLERDLAADIEIDDGGTSTRTCTTTWSLFASTLRGLRRGARPRGHLDRMDRIAYGGVLIAWRMRSAAAPGSCFVVQELIRRLDARQASTAGARGQRGLIMASIQKRENGRWRARYRDAAGKEHARHFDRKLRRAALVERDHHGHRHRPLRRPGRRRSPFRRGGRTGPPCRSGPGVPSSRPTWPRPRSPSPTCRCATSGASTSSSG